ncbi:hypothetical protein GIY30_17490 [Gordonia sp. HNM0687]|uniref:Diacylglycerol O-acyltransferase n=1 Tax=Gordonia mangrovi TaxID=2665643 RepID=A0A6L7GSY6_9ACTN|nr:hypothetical protein [Gordonia mangrovi]MXP23134.1 hypothetical protein [Gordonia mangrovi]UVF77415.1 hypothetical protein NWF22_19310 [Gordonia mangrovi]
MTAHIERTTHDDDLFIRMDRAFGVPVLSQAIWRLTEPLSADELERLGRRLLDTPISRRLHTSRMPLARDYWLAAPGTAGRSHNDPPLADDEIVDWLDRAAEVEFDLEAGPVWELRAAPLKSGGGMVTMCSSHAVGDGWLGARAIYQATSTDDLSVPYRPTPPNLLADARDALGQATTIGRGITGLIGDRWAARGSTETAGPQPVTSRSIPRPPTPEDDVLAREEPIRAPLAIVAMPGDDWRSVVDAHQGSANALFMAIVVGLIVDAGRATWDDTVRVSVPMSMRSGDDTRANSTTGLTLDIPAAWSRERDLAAIRTLAKATYQESAATTSRLSRLQPLMQALPDGLMTRLSRSGATPLALASSGGAVDPTFAGLGDPSRVGAFASRATTQGVSRERLTRLRGGLATWFNDTGATATLSVSGLDPAAFPTSEVLSEKVQKECARWGLTTSPW